VGAGKDSLGIMLGFSRDDFRIIFEALAWKHVK